MGMSTLIAEDLLLLLLDDDSGKLDATYLTPLLGGAVLLELAMAESLEVRKNGAWSSAKVHVLTDARQPSDPILVDALRTTGDKERTAQDLVNRLGKGLKETLLERLVERGIVAHQEDRVWGIFPRERWPAIDSSHEDVVRRQLAAALLEGARPEDRTAALIALLHAVSKAHRILADNHGIAARQIRSRAKEIADGEWAAKAVRDAVVSAQAAMTAATTAATTAAVTSG